MFILNLYQINMGIKTLKEAKYLRWDIKRIDNSNNNFV